MNDYFNEIDLALEHELYYLALFSSLTIPDMFGAIGSQDGIASGKKYKDWFKKYYPKKETIGNNEVDTCITAEICWNLRCSILHQGSSTPKGFKPQSQNLPLMLNNLQNASPSSISNQQGIQYSRIIFSLPSSIIYHCNVTGSGSDIELNINLKIFCKAMLKGAKQWLQQNENTANYQNNVSKFLKHYPSGFGNFVGISVLSND